MVREFKNKYKEALYSDFVVLSSPVIQYLPHTTWVCKNPYASGCNQTGVPLAVKPTLYHNATNASSMAIALTPDLLHFKQTLYHWIVKVVEKSCYKENATKLSQEVFSNLIVESL